MNALLLVASLIGTPDLLLEDDADARYAAGLAIVLDDNTAQIESLSGDTRVTTTDASNITVIWVAEPAAAQPERQARAPAVSPALSQIAVLEAFAFAREIGEACSRTSPPVAQKARAVTVLHKPAVAKLRSKS